MAPRRGRYALTRAAQARLLAAQKKEPQYELRVEEIKFEPDPNIDYSKLPPIDVHEYERGMNKNIRKIIAAEQEFNKTVVLLKRARLNVLDARKQAINNGTDKEFLERASVFEKIRDNKIEKEKQLLAIKIAAKERVRDAEIHYNENKYKERIMLPHERHLENAVRKERRLIRMIGLIQKKIGLVRWKIYDRDEALKQGKKIPRFKPNYARTDAYKEMLGYPLVVRKAKKSDIEEDVEFCKKIILHHDIQETLKNKMPEPRLPYLKLWENVAETLLEPGEEEVKSDEKKKEESSTAKHEKAKTLDASKSDEIKQEVASIQKSKTARKGKISTVPEVEIMCTAETVYEETKPFTESTSITAEIKQENVSPQKLKAQKRKMEDTSMTPLKASKVEIMPAVASKSSDSTAPKSVSPRKEPSTSKEQDEADIKMDPDEEIAINPFRHPLFIDNEAALAIMKKFRKKVLKQKLKEMKKEERRKRKLRMKGQLVPILKKEKSDASEVSTIKEFVRSSEPVKRRMRLLAETPAEKPKTKKRVTFGEPIAIRRLITFEPAIHDKKNCKKRKVQPKEFNKEIKEEVIDPEEQIKKEPIKKVMPFPEKPKEPIAKKEKVQQATKPIPENVHFMQREEVVQHYFEEGDGVGPENYVDEGNEDEFIDVEMLDETEQSIRVETLEEIRFEEVAKGEHLVEHKVEKRKMTTEKKHLVKEKLSKGESSKEKKIIENVRKEEKLKNEEKSKKDEKIKQEQKSKKEEYVKRDDKTKAVENNNKEMKYKKEDKPKVEEKYKKDEKAQSGIKLKTETKSKKEEKPKVQEKPKQKEREVEVIKVKKPPNRKKALEKEIKKEPIEQEEEVVPDPSTSIASLTFILPSESQKKQTTKQQTPKTSKKEQAQLFPIIGVPLPLRKAASDAVAKFSQPKKPPLKKKEQAKKPPPLPKKAQISKQTRAGPSFTTDFMDREIKEELLTAAEMEAMASRSPPKGHRK